MKTLSKILIVPALLGALFVLAPAARADWHSRHYHWARTVHHYRRLDARGERLVARGAYLKRHGHLVRGRHLERVGAHMDHSADRWMHHTGVRDTE